jgi:hypothetical protein
MTREQVNIRPTTAIYGYFKKLSYDPWHAISEFVDNSTQSYFDHENELKNSKDWTKLKVEIEYKENNNGCITITDNAFGMDFTDFKRALILNSKPANTSGRSEFGMGLKTAACWFGSYWTVTSTRLGENEEYHTNFDVNDFETRQQADIDIDINQVPREKHGTVIVISKLYKGLKGRTISKIKEVLSSTYRRDIQSGKISIIFNGDELTYKEPEIYCDDGTVYKQSLSFTVNHSGTEYPVKGYVAIRESGSVENSGFALIRRGRVIESNYRPTELFGKQNSFAYQRLIGEFDMDDWPVTQAKDKFDWSNDGLEDDFIEALKPLIHDYKKIAENRRKRTEQGNKKIDDAKKEDDQAVNKSGDKEINSQFNAIPQSENVFPSGVQNETNGKIIVSVAKQGEGNEATGPSFNRAASSLALTPSTNSNYSFPSAVVSPKTWKRVCKFEGEEYPLKIETVEIDGSPLIKIINSVDDNDPVTCVRINLLHSFFKGRRDQKTADAIIAIAVSMARC